jgi:hypothetical protein
VEAIRAGMIAIDFMLNNLTASDHADALEHNESRTKKATTLSDCGSVDSASNYNPCGGGVNDCCCGFVWGVVVCGCVGLGACCGVFCIGAEGCVADGTVFAGLLVEGELTVESVVEV